MNDQLIQDMANASNEDMRLNGPIEDDSIIEDIPRGVAGGVIGLGQSLGDIVDVGGEALGFDPFDDKMLTREGRPDWAKPRTFVGGLTEGVTQAALAFIPVAGIAGRASKVVRGVGLVARAIETGGVVGKGASLLTSQGFIGGALVDAVAFRGDEGRLSDLLVDMGGLGDNAVTRWLSTQEDDSWIEGRVKNTIEGAMLGIGWDALIEPAMAAVKGRVSKSAGVLFQNPKDSAERGLIPPDLADIDWGSEQFASGVNRDQFATQLKDAVGDEKVSSAAMTLTDQYMKLYAATNKITLDEAYAKKLAGVVTDVTNPDLMQPMLSADIKNSPFTQVLDSLPKNKRGKNNLQDVQTSLWKFITGDGNFIQKGDYSPENKQKLANFLTEELKASDSGALADKSRGWYNRRFSMAVQAAADHFDLPTIATDERDRFMFTALTAIFSQGKTPTQNLDNAIRATKEWIGGGRKQVAPPSWFKDDKIKPDQFVKLQKAIELNGGDLQKTSQWMTGDASVGDLKKLGFDVSGELVDAKLPRAVILGPKIGAFFANLSGHSGALTMDLWWMRTIRRGTGDFAQDIDPKTVTEYVQGGYKKGLEAAKGLKGPKKVSFPKDKAGDIEFIRKWMEPLAKSADNKDFKGMTADEWLANRLRDQLDPTIAEEPGSGASRQFMRESFNDALKAYNATSGRPPLSAADAQAVLWHHEKNLWKDTFNVIPRDGGDFFDSAVKLAEKKGVALDAAGYESKFAQADQNAGGRDGRVQQPDARTDGTAVLNQSPADGLGHGRRADAAGQGSLFGDPTGPRGAVKFLEDGRAVIALMKGSDASTVVHELGHVFRRNLSEISPELSAAADKWVGATAGKRWSRKQEELWAETFESYLSKGLAPTPELKGIFEKFADWIKGVYKGILNSPLGREVNPEIRKVFDAMLGEGWNRSDPARSRPLNVPPNVPSERAREVRKKLTGTSKSQRYVSVDESRAKQIADAYDAMPHAPNDPAVKASYEALAKETRQQYDAMVAEGIEIVPWASKGEPYKSSQEMVADVETHKRLYFLKSIDENFGSGGQVTDNPLLGKTGITLKDSAGKDYELTHNDLFRAVHDFFGHATEGYQFGPRGEENAWRVHSQMYSESARPAMTSETRGQNSWVNYNSKLRRPDGTIPRKGDADFIEASKRPFADQKTGLLPDWTWKDGVEDTASLAADLHHTYSEALKTGMSATEAGQTAITYHINHGRLNVTDRAEMILRAVEVIGQQKIDAEIGSVQSLDEMLKIAREEAVDPQAVYDSVVKGVGDTRNIASTTVAARMTLAAFAEETLIHATRYSEWVAAHGYDNVPNELADAFYTHLTAVENMDAYRGMLQKQLARATTAGNIEVGVRDAGALSREWGEPSLNLSAAIRGTDPESEAILKVAAEQAAKGQQELSEALKSFVDKKTVKPQAREKTPKTKPAGENVPAASGSPGAPSVSPSVAPAAPAVASTGTPQAQPRAPRGTLTRQQAQNVAKVVNAYQTAQAAGQVTRLNKQVKQAYRSGVLDSLLEVYKASILSGIPTMTLNALSGGMNTVMQPIAKTLGALTVGDAAGAKAGFRLMTQTVAAIGDMVKYTMMSPQGNGPQGLRSLKSIWTDEKAVLTGVSGIEHRRAIHPESYGINPQSAAGRASLAFGKFVRLPFMANQSIEEFWGQLNYIAYVRSKALDMADQAVWGNAGIPQHLKAAQASQLVDQFVTDAFDNFGRAQGSPTGFKHEDAVAYSKSVNFTQDLVYGFGNSLMELKGKHPILDIVIPFIRVPTNLMRTAIRFTPGLNLLQERYMGRMMSRTPDEVMRARGEMVLGAAFWGYAGYMAASGQITGGGPVEKNERDALLNSGWRPYSFVVTNPDGKKEYVEFKRFDPVSTVFGLAADFADTSAYLADGERDQLAGAMVLALANNLTSKTYLQGIAETTRMLMRPDQYGAAYLRNRVAAFVPNFSARAASANDDYMREVRSVMDAIKRRVPGYSETLPPRRNILGEPMTPPAGYLPFTDTLSKGSAQNASRMLSPVTVSQQTTDGVKLEMARMSHGFSMPATKLNGVDLTLLKNQRGQDAYDRLVELTGQVKLNGMTVHDALNKLVSSAYYQKLPLPEGRNDNSNPRLVAMQRVLSNYRQVARSRLFKEFPKLLESTRDPLASQRTPSTSQPLLAALAR